MPVATRAQKRKREPEPTKIQDLPFELIEEIAHDLDVKDVAKLMMMNKKLHTSYAKNRSIVFGKHVALVGLGLISCSRKVCIKKFINSRLSKLNATRLPFGKRVESCNKLVVSDIEFRTYTMFLNQLKFVNELKSTLFTKERYQKFFSNFHGSVKKHAELYLGIDSLEQDQAMKEQLSKFIENQLNGCEKITLTVEVQGCFHVYHEALMKTQIKIIWVEVFCLQFSQMVDWIVTKEIPSKNSEAVFLLRNLSCSKKHMTHARTDDSLSQVQGLQRVDDGENHLALVSRANELLRQIDVSPRLFDQNSLCYRRRIDPTTTCIYVSYRYCGGLKAQFLAFYMPSQ